MVNADAQNNLLDYIIFVFGITANNEASYITKIHLFGYIYLLISLKNHNKTGKKLMMD